VVFVGDGMRNIKDAWNELVEASECEKDED